jgi:hypothetical protein
MFSARVCSGSLCNHREIIPEGSAQRQEDWTRIITLTGASVVTAPRSGCHPVTMYYGGSWNRRSPRSGTGQLRNLKKLFGTRLLPLLQQCYVGSHTTHRDE